MNESELWSLVEEEGAALVQTEEFGEIVICKSPDTEIPEQLGALPVLTFDLLHQIHQDYDDPDQRHTVLRQIVEYQDQTKDVDADELKQILASDWL